MKMKENKELPKGWKWVKLKEIAEVKGGKRLPKGAEYEDGKTEFPYIRVTDFENNTINQNNLKYLNSKVQNAIKNYTISSEDLYISIAGTIGKVGLVPINLCGANLTENAAKITQIKNINLKYLLCLLNSETVQKQIQKQTIATTQPKLALYKIENLDLILPPIGIQENISNKIEELFSEVDKGIENLKLTQQQLKTYRQSVLKWAFEGKLSKNTIDERKSQDEWTVMTIGKCAKLINGDRGKNYPNRNEYTENGIPFINTGHIKPDGNLELELMNYISKHKYDSLNSGKIKPNDLVYCLRGATIGKTAIITQFKEGAIASSLVIIRPNSEINSKFLYYYLISPIGKKVIKLYDNGTAQPNLSAASLSKYVIPFTNIKHQKEIVLEIENRISVIDNLEEIILQNIKKSESLKQSILKKAFEGTLIK
jgi:restriction endonuclease S subunit